MNNDKPDYQLRPVGRDGEKREMKIVEVAGQRTDLPLDRRSFVGTGLSIASALLSFGGVKNKAIATDTSTQLLAHAFAVWDLVLTPDEKILASCGNDNLIRLWNLPGGGFIKKLTGHSNSVLCLKISHDGTLLISGDSSGGLKMWSLPTGNFVGDLVGHTGKISRMAISPDGALLATGSGDGTIRLWALPSGQHIVRLTGHTGVLNTLRFSPDGSLLASAADNDSKVRLWSIPSGDSLGLLSGHSSGVSDITFTPDGKMIASIANDRLVKLWTMPAMQLAATLSGHTSYGTSLTVSPDGKVLASVSNEIRLWALPGGQSLGTLNAGYSASTASAQLTATSGGILIACGSHERISLWSLSYVPITFRPSQTDQGSQELAWEGVGTLEEAAEIDGPWTPIPSAISPHIIPKTDVKKFYRVTSGQVPSGRAIREITRHLARVSCFRVTRDEKMLISCDVNGAIAFHNLSTGEFLGNAFDPAANPASVSATTFNVLDPITNQLVTYSLPCGSPIPANATCACNCVAGTYSGGGSSGCSIIVCTCNPIFLP